VNSWYNKEVINTNASIILLTYKNKLLLTFKEYSPIFTGPHTWHVIGSTKGTNESFEDAIKRKVKKDTGLQLSRIDFLSCSSDKTQQYFHSELTDTHVNSIVRENGQVIQFFSANELETLVLSPMTEQLISKHRGVVESTSQN
jgi:hypothetical protein